MKLPLLSLIISLLSLSFLFSQPSNDVCSSAIPLGAVTATCTYVQYDNLNATDSGNGAPGCGFYYGADVWFSVVVPASGHLVIDQLAGTLNNTAMAVYTGACGSLNLYECDDNDSPNGGMPQIVLDQDTLGGQTVYIQVWRRASVIGGTFQICAFEPSIPANAVCSDAVFLPVAADKASVTYATYTNEYAGSSNAPAPGCGFYYGTDVWFGMVVPAGGKVVINHLAGSLNNTAMAVYTGTCGSLTLYECDDSDAPGSGMPEIIINDLSLAGQTIYIRAWRRANVNGGTFQIGAFIPSIPVNVDCTNAISIPVAADKASVSYATYTNEYAGNSTAPAPGCGFYYGTDVWFSLVVPAGGKLVINQLAAGLNNIGMAVYTGTCGSLVLYECDDSDAPGSGMPEIILNDLSLAGQTIYIRVWRRASVNGGTFQIGAFIPVIPANVDCANAFSIPVAADKPSVTYSTYTNEYAGSSTAPATGCGFYYGTDVWFSMVVPAGGKVVINQMAGTLTNTAMAVYTGTCGSLTLYECDDSDAPGSGMPEIVINDVTLAGQTIYIRVWRRASVNGGTFQIGAFIPFIPDYIDCANAAPLTIKTGVNDFDIYTNEYARTSGEGSPGCGFYYGTDVWFTVVMPPSGQLTIDQIQGTLTNTAMSIYTGSCGTLVEYACDDNSSANGSMPMMVVNDAGLIGQTLYIQVWRRASVNGGSFGLIAYDPTALPVEWVYVDATPIAENNVRVSWATASEQNNDFFEVERSIDGQIFESLGQVTATGNSQQTREYEWTDTRVPNGNWYYRIRQVDLDGNFSHSQQVEVTLEGIQVIAYPNPFSETLFLLAPASNDEEVSVTVTDLLGREIYKCLSTGPVTLSLDSQSWQPGMYWILVEVGEGKSSEAFPVIKK